MTIHYLDPSAWLKRYFKEPGTESMSRLFDGAVMMACARFGLLEVVAAIARRSHREGIAAGTIERQVGLARRDYALFRQVAWDESLTETAEQLAIVHHLRGADAIHLAAVLQLRGQGELVVVSADEELLAAVVREGLGVLNPVAIAGE